MLRALAVLMVLGRHIPAPVQRSDAGGFDAFLWLWRRCGWAGVDLFFVLSGFLVAGLLFRERQRHGAISIGRFYVRRALRLYPAFYFMLFTTLGLAWATGNRFPSARRLLGELLYLQNYVGQVWGHTWSLAIEEHFYLALPPLLLALGISRGRLSAGRVLAVYALLAAGCLLLRLRLEPDPFLVQTHLQPTHLRADGLWCGVALSYLHHEQPGWLRPWLSGWRRALLLLFAALALSPLLLFELAATPRLASLGLLGTQLGFAALLLLALGLRLEGRFWRPLSLVGACSYSIYLWHQPISDLTVLFSRDLVGIPRQAWLAVYLISSLGVGIVTAYLIELPLLGLRDKRYPRREGALELARRDASDSASA